MRDLPGHPPSEPSEPPPLTRSQRILVVEDHADTAALLSKVLTRTGHIVRTAGTFAQAKSLCQTEGFGVVLCDIGLPDGRGTALLPLIRAACPDAKVIAVTGCGMPDEIEEVKRAGFDAYLLKPIAVPDLLAYVSPDAID